LQLCWSLANGKPVNRLADRTRASGFRWKDPSDREPEWPQVAVEVEVTDIAVP